MIKEFYNWLFGVNQKDKEIKTNLTNLLKEYGFMQPQEKKEIIEEAPKSDLYRPEIFDNYIGQEKAKSILKSYITSLKDRGQILPHILIHGKAGCGKTTLARIIANEFGFKINEVIASRLTNFQDFIEIFKNSKNSIVFFDEVHAIPRNLVEQIYTIMEDGIYDNIKLPPFTLISATTELGEILKDRKPFYERFKIVIELEDYSKKELEQLLITYKINMFGGDELNNNIYSILARNCRGTPRTALRYLEATIYLNGNVRKVLENFNIIKDGFTTRDLETLKYISKNKSGLGLQGLASYLGISEQNYSYEIEPYLLSKHLVLRTPRGRKITEDGLNKIIELEEWLSYKRKKDEDT